MTVAIVGASGHLGSALRATGGDRPGVSWLDRAALDVTDASAVRGHPALDAEWVVNLAAFTDVDGAESAPERARELNAVAPALLARRCADTGARLIHVSTDYVFGSSPVSDLRRPACPEDPPAPLGVYGATKLEGERACGRILGERAIVVRTAWIFSGDALPHPDFVSTMARLARSGDEPSVVMDQVGSPTFAFDLARALWRLLDVDTLPGAAGGPASARLIHLAGAGHASRYELACEVFRLLGRDPGAVRAITTAEYPTPARRPAWSVLRSDVELPGWRDAVARALSGPSVS